MRVTEILSVTTPLGFSLPVRPTCSAYPWPSVWTSWRKNGSATPRDSATTAFLAEDFVVRVARKNRTTTAHSSTRIHTGFRNQQRRIAGLLSACWSECFIAQLGFNIFRNVSAPTRSFVLSCHVRISELIIIVTYLLSEGLRSDDNDDEIDDKGDKANFRVGTCCCCLQQAALRALLSVVCEILSLLITHFGTSKVEFFK